jgi:signal transduction histidine kinase/DNA-binding response OmpR family regulator
LRARGSDGSYSPQQIHLGLLVKKPFYLKPGFLISAVIALFLGIWLLLRFRTQQLQRQKKVLEDMVGIRTRQIEQDKKTIEKQAAELQELDKLKTRFFTNISHELRTPITLILGPVQQLIQKAAGKFSKEMLDPLFMIRKNAQSLLQLTEELLELARLESGQLSLDLKPTDFQLFCKQIFSAFELKAQFKKISYRMIYDLEAPLFLEIDENSLGKILNNLLSNAIKFSFSGGEIIFEIRREADQFLMAVQDKGPGIAEEDLPHVFDRFFQTKKRQASNKGGTGIGLSLSKELALLMQGELEVESQQGEGSRFCLRFPAREVESMPQVGESQEAFLLKKEEASKGEAPSSNTEKRHILIVEDNPDIQQFLRSILENAYHITAAYDGQEGWECLEKQATGALPVSLILSDIMMPRMDGYALLDKVKSHPIHRQLPVIMLTALAAEKDKLTALRMGVDDYLSKPFSPEELQARLQNLLHNYQQRQAFQQENGLLQKLEDQAPAPVDDAWLQQLEQLILDTLDKGMSPLVSDLASSMASSERQLLRRVKSLTGLSIKNYSQEVKLQKARILLEKKSFATIAEVAYSSGFNTPAYFSKVFEKRFGKRPADYLSANPE